MTQKKNKSVNDRRTVEGARELSVSRVISTREAKQKFVRGFYCRPDVLDVVARRLLQTFRLFTDHATPEENKSPRDSSLSPPSSKKTS
jgi:hypothetical protein